MFWDLVSQNKSQRNSINVRKLNKGESDYLGGTKLTQNLNYDQSDAEINDMYR